MGHIGNEFICLRWILRLGITEFIFIEIVYGICMSMNGVKNSSRMIMMSVNVRSGKQNFFHFRYISWGD